MEMFWELRRITCISATLDRMTGDGTEAISDRDKAAIGRTVQKIRRDEMETWYYTVVSIDGDYANLKRTDIESDDLKLVARALLPADIYEGCKLRYELMQYYLEQN